MTHPLSFFILEIVDLIFWLRICFVNNMNTRFSPEELLALFNRIETFLDSQTFNFRIKCNLSFDLSFLPHHLNIEGLKDKFMKSVF